jgi:hypothetical protein
VTRELTDVIEHAAFDVGRGPVSAPGCNSVVIGGHDGVTAGLGNVQDVTTDVRVTKMDTSAFFMTLGELDDLDLPRPPGALRTLPDQEWPREPHPPHDDLVLGPRSPDQGPDTGIGRPGSGFGL